VTTGKPVGRARRIAEGVAAQGVRWIFEAPGGNVDQIYDALADGWPQLVVCRQQQDATFIAWYRVNSADEFRAALDKPLGEDGPAIIDVAVDYSPSTASQPSCARTYSNERQVSRRGKETPSRPPKGARASVLRRDKAPVQLSAARRKAGLPWIGLFVEAKTAAAEIACRNKSIAPATSRIIGDQEVPKTVIRRSTAYGQAEVVGVNKEQP
jgi:hypothetical protein